MTHEKKYTTKWYVCITLKGGVVRDCGTTNIVHTYDKFNMRFPFGLYEKMMMMMIKEFLYDDNEKKKKGAFVDQILLGG